MQYMNIESMEAGYKRGLENIKEMGIEWAKHMFGLRLKCTGIDPSWTVGYGKAIAEYKD